MRTRAEELSRAREASRTRVGDALNVVAQEQQGILKTFVRGYDRGFEAGDSHGYQRCDEKNKADTKLRLERVAARRALLKPSASAMADSADTRAHASLVNLEPAITTMTSSKARRLRRDDAIAALAALPRPVHQPPKPAPGASKGRKRRHSSISKALSP
jgi:hypothetical protein